MRRRSALTLALAGLMFWSIGVGEATKAEGLSLALVSYELIPSSEYAPDTLERNELNTTARTVTVKLAVPILLSGKNSILLNFFTLRSLYQTYENAEAAGVLFRPDYLYTFKYGLVFRQVLSDKWNLALLAQLAC
ncbi:MAG: hypothetical protein ACE5FH_09180 [Candidatus Zixiibacteriota bacterium]